MIRNAAIEPEICDLVRMLKKMGARITIEEDESISEEITPFGIIEKIKKWNVITVNGCSSLKNVTHQVMPDRIEFGTYAIVAAMTNGRCQCYGFKETPLSVLNNSHTRSRKGHS